MRTARTQANWLELAMKVVTPYLGARVLASAPGVAIVVGDEAAFLIAKVVVTCKLRLR